MSSRVMSRSHSRLPSDDEVLEEDDLANLSFTSHISSMGRAQGAAADLESIATAAAAAQQRGTNADAAVPAQEVPVETIDTFSVKDTVKKFMVTGYPLTGSTLSQFSLGTVIISVVGKCLGVEELGGASLALGLVNATGFAFGAGLCGALETVLSHTYGKFARGEEDEAVDKEENLASLKIYGIYAQRMAAILFIVAFPLGIILCFADALLSAVGEDEQVVRYTGIWCRMAVFGVPATLAYQLVQRYYSCQHLTKPLSIAMITAALVNPLLQLLFVKMFGFHGSPIAWLLLMTCITGGLIWHMQRSGLAKKTWSGWDERSLRNIGSLARIAIPSMGVMLSEWVALEINALAAGFATPNELAAFSITAQLFGIMWGIGSGCIILTCVFVGNAIGAGQPLVARSIAFTAIGLVFIISLIDVIVFYIFGDYIPYLFTNDDEVAQIYKSLMNIVLPYHLMDTFQSTVMAILRGCELQKLGAVIITTAFCAVGVPLSFLLFFHFDIGVRALWIGPFVGVSVVGFPLYVYILLRYIDWSQLKPHKDGDHVEGGRPPSTEGGAAVA